MPSSFAPNEQTVISKRAPLPAPAETLHGSRPAQIGKSLEGQQLGQFLLEEFVGGGGMGAVFRAIDKTLDRIVAVKVVSSEQTDEDTLRRFRNEAQSAARLDHPNIARVYSVGEEAGWNYIVFEFIEGVNVRDLVVHKGPLPLDEAISYVVQVSEALEHASQRDVVHRDIKPSNLLVMQDGRAKLVDMGLARLHQVESSAEDLTATGVTLGTFDYISPEQARDPRDTDVRSDLYSLGCTFYYMLTGMPPFPEGTVLQKLLSHSSESPPDPRDLRADLPQEISAITMKLMAKLPSQRYQRPNELTAELMKLCEELGFVTPTTRGLLLPGRDSVTSKFAQHLPWLVPICLLFAVVFGVDAMLPQAAHVTHSELMPFASLEPSEAAERSVPVHDRETPLQSPPPRSENGDGESTPTRASERAIDSEPLPSEVEDPPVTDSGAGTNGVTPSSGEAPSSTTRSEEAPFAEAAAVMEVAPANAVLEVESEAGMPKAEIPIALPLPPPEATQSVGADPQNAINPKTDRLFVIPEGLPTPDPMVVQSLEAALRRIADHPEIRVIELHCDRYEASPLTIDLRGDLTADGSHGSDLVTTSPLTIDLRGDLTIEAGKGFSPLLVFDQRDASTLGERRMVHLLGGRLTLRGLHFRVDLPYTSESGWALFHLHQVQDLTLEQCTLTVRNDDRADAAFFHIQSPRMPEMPIPGSNVPVPPRPNLTLESCVARGEATFVRATEGLPFKLEFTQGLLATSERMIELGQRSEAVPQEVVKVFLQHVTAEMGLGLCRATLRDAGSRLPQLEVNAENCLLDHNARVPLIEHVGVRDVAATISYAIDLTGKSNAYPRTNVLWRIEPREGDRVEVVWDARFDPENAWYKDTLPDRYAPWLDSRRKPDRVMHQVTPSDYLVVDEEEMGFHLAELPELPPEDETTAELD